MIYRKIKGTDLKSSIIGFGTWGLSGKVYGKITKSRSKRLLEYAIDNGINFFDTSSLYGDGSVEKILGETLEPYKNSKKLVIATKVGMIKNNKNYFVPKYNFSTFYTLKPHKNYSFYLKIKFFIRFSILEYFMRILFKFKSNSLY